MKISEAPRIFITLSKYAQILALFLCTGFWSIDIDYLQNGEIALIIISP